MFEFLVLLVGAMPFLIGIYAVRIIKKSNDNGSDDQPPPPDPKPPLPVLPPSPEPRRLHRPLRERSSRGPVQHSRLGTPGWHHRVHC